MRRLLFSAIILSMFSIALNACGGSADDITDTGNDTTNDDNIDDDNIDDDNIDDDNIDDDNIDDNNTSTPTKTLNFSNDDMTVNLSQDWKNYIAHFKTPDRSLSKASESVINKAIGMDALAVFGSQRMDNTRSANQSWDEADSEQTITIIRLLGAAAVIYFDGVGADSKISKLEANFSGITHIVDNFTSASKLSASSDKAHNLMAVEISDADSATLTAERGTAFFGFDSDHMVSAIITSDRAGDFTSANTSTKEYSYDYDALMLAGIQSNVTDFPTTQNDVTFTGAGKGIYGVLDASNMHKNYHTNFTVTATANFMKRIMDITTTNTACVDKNCTLPANLDLNLTASNLSFANKDNTASINIISGDVTAGNLSGKIDARFYGGAAQEFGGIFSLAEQDKRYYYGAFGAKKE